MPQTSFMLAKMEKVKAFAFAIALPFFLTNCVQLQGAATGVAACGGVALSSSPEVGLAAAGICGFLGFYYGGKLEQIRVDAFQTEQELNALLQDLQIQNELMVKYNQILEARKAGLLEKLTRFGKLENLKSEQLQLAQADMAEFKNIARIDLVRIDEELLPRVRSAIASVNRLDKATKPELLAKLEEQKEQLLLSKMRLYTIVEL